LHLFLFINIIKDVIGLLPTNIYIILLYQPDLFIATFFNFFLYPFCISRLIYFNKLSFVSVFFNLLNNRFVNSCVSCILFLIIFCFLFAYHVQLILRSSRLFLFLLIFVKIVL